MTCVLELELALATSLKAKKPRFRSKTECLCASTSTNGSEFKPTWLSSFHEAINFHLSANLRADPLRLQPARATERGKTRAHNLHLRRSEERRVGKECR